MKKYILVLTEQEIHWLTNALQRANAREHEIGIELGLKPNMHYQHLLYRVDDAEEKKETC